MGFTLQQAALYNNVDSDSDSDSDVNVNVQVDDDYDDLSCKITNKQAVT